MIIQTIQYRPGRQNWEKTKLLSEEHSGCKYIHLCISLCALPERQIAASMLLLNSTLFLLQSVSEHKGEMGRWENTVNSLRKAHKGNALHTLDWWDRTGDRGVGSKQQRKQIAGEWWGQSRWWQDATALGVRTPLVVCGAGLRLARLAKWASFRNMLVWRWWQQP